MGGNLHPDPAPRFPRLSHPRPGRLSSTIRSPKGEWNPGQPVPEPDPLRRVAFPWLAGGSMLEGMDLSEAVEEHNRESPGRAGYAEGGKCHAGERSPPRVL
jgi:hypothetical protein